MSRDLASQLVSLEIDDMVEIGYDMPVLTIEQREEVLRNVSNNDYFWEMLRDIIKETISLVCEED